MFGQKLKNKKQRRRSSDQQSKRLYSYYSNTRMRDEQPERSRLNSPKDRLPSPKNWWQNIPSLLAMIAILISAGYILSINMNPKIIQLSDDKSIFLHDKNTYQQAANKIINKSLLNYNKVTFNVAGISHALKDQFPELSDVSITMPLINRRPIIYLTASQPTLLLISESSSLVINSKGVAILPAGQVANITKYGLLTVRDESNLDVAIGKAALPSSTVKFLTDSFRQFQAESQTVDQFTLPSAPSELDVKLAGQKYFIKLDIQGDSREQVGAYIAAKNKLNSLHIQPQEYIDARVVGRVFYK